MAASIRINQLQISDVEWDAELARFEEPCVFVRSVWLRYLRETQGGTIIHAEIIAAERRVGLLCGLLIQKGPFRIFGSPLRGWWTIRMGLLMHGATKPSPEVLEAFECFMVAKQVDYVEVAQLDLPIEFMLGRGFTPIPFPTFWVTLDSVVEKVFESLHGTCRNRIRKAQSNGLTVEQATDGLFVDQYYAQIAAIFAAQKLAMPRSMEAVRTLYDHLLEAGHVLALRVKSPEGKTIATGLFPFDDASIYFLGGASLAEARKLCPNELLHWEAIKFGITHGMRIYDMGGGLGLFKKKFGGAPITIYRWRKSYSWTTGVACNLYQRAFYAQQKLRGLVASLSVRTLNR